MSDVRGWRLGRTVGWNGLEAICKMAASELHLECDPGEGLEAEGTASD